MGSEEALSLDPFRALIRPSAPQEKAPSDDEVHEVVCKRAPRVEIT